MIPAFLHTCTEDIYSIPIVDDGSALCVVSDSAYWRVESAYYAQNINGAIDICYLRPEVITRLEKAAREIANQTGWQLVILDGWRPTTLQQALYHDIYEQICQQYPHESEEQLILRTQEFVSLPSKDPNRPSPHLTGGSVDVTLCDATGQALDMGSAFDEPTMRSYTDAYEQTPGPIRERRRLLYQAMTNASFTNLPTEWWHYDFGNQNWAYYSGNAEAIYGPAYPDGD